MQVEIFGLDCEVDIDGAVIGAVSHGVDLSDCLPLTTWEMLAEDLRAEHEKQQLRDAVETYWEKAA